MSDRRIHVFHAVAKQLSFTKAAEALFMTQPAVTFQIRQLEEEFNTRLFDRKRGQVTLTAAGVLALEYSEHIVALTAELKARMRDIGSSVGGQLRIGASTTLAGFVLPPIIAEFKSRYPAVVPRLYVANSATIRARLIERAFDIGFIEGVSHEPALVMDPCCKDELQLVCTPDHPLAQNKVVEPEQLVHHHYINREEGSGTREVIDRYLQDAGLSPGLLQIVTEAGSPEAVKALMIAKMGYAIMPVSSVAKEVQLGQLVRIALVPRLVRQLSSIYPKERIQSRLLMSFLGFAKQRLGA